MFQLGRDEAERALRWGPKQLQFLEAWKYKNIHTTTPWNFRHGSLDSRQLQDWLHHQGSFTAPTAPESAGPIQGGIRLLICDFIPFQEPTMGISVEDFRLVESAFKLHPATLPALQVNPGTFSRHLQKNAASTLENISIVLKAPQKYEIANYMLSFTYDCSTRWTTALLAGEKVMSSRSTLNDYSPAEYTQGIQYQNFAPATTIRAVVCQNLHLWNHPLLLPCILVTDHLKRLQKFCEGPLTEAVMSIEEQLGVTRVGRRLVKGPVSRGQRGRRNTSSMIVTEKYMSSNELIEPSQALNLTISINTQLTKVHFTQRSPTWNHEMSQYLLKILHEFEESSRDLFLLENGEVSDLLEHNANLAKSIEGSVSGLQTRLNLQLNVLYSFVAQTDNRLNARLAATSGRDSTSMKILAFITTIFLPGTYVATLFSMSMFNWQPDSSNSNNAGGSSVLSSKFWIYWVVSIPLTLLTLGGWALWWNFEKRRYDMYTTEAKKKF